MGNDIIKDAAIAPVSAGEQVQQTPEEQWAASTEADLTNNHKTISSEKDAQAATRAVRDAMAAPHGGVELSALTPEERQAVLDRRFETTKQILETWSESIELNARLDKDTFKRRLISQAADVRQNPYGVYQVKSGDTLTKVADQVARQVGLPMATDAERKASTDQILDRIYELNPRFDREAASDGNVDWTGWGTDGEGVQDPDAVMPGEKVRAPLTIRVPVTAPAAQEAPTPTHVGPPLLDLTGGDKPITDPLFSLTPNSGAGSVDTSATTVGQVGPTVAARASGPLLIEPAGRELRDTVHDGLTQRLGYAPHQDVVRMVSENVSYHDDGRVIIPDRDGIIQLYETKYGIDPSQGEVIIAGEHDRWSNVLEDNFYMGKPEDMPWGARGLLIRTIMKMNEIQPRHNVEMPGVVVIPTNEADFAERALAENGFAGQETRRYAGPRVEPGRQVETLSYYLTRVLDRPVSHDDVRGYLANPTPLPTAGRAYARTEADENWPRDAVVDAYKDLFDPNHPDFKDIPRDRLAAMVMMTVAQANNLGPDAFTGCSQMYFIDATKMTSLVRDMHVERDRNNRNVFDAFDGMAANIGKLDDPGARATAQLWHDLNATHAVGSGQVASRLLDSPPMPMVLIDSAAVAQQLSQEDMNQVFGVLSSSAWVRGAVTNPVGGPLSWFGFPTGGLMAMLDVMAAANSNKGERNPGESMVDWLRRTGDESPAEIALFAQQVATVDPRVRPVIVELARLGQGEGWRWDSEDQRLVIDDASRYQDVIASMDLSPKSREALEKWLGEMFQNREPTGTLTLDIEHIGVMYEIAHEAPRESTVSPNTFAEDLPRGYYDLDDYYLFDGAGESFSTIDEGSLETSKSVFDSIEKSDMRLLATQQKSDRAKVEKAKLEILEHSDQLRSFIESIHSDSRKYQQAISRMNQIVAQWAAKGEGIRGPLTSDLVAGMGIR